jgi:hypothetical protein
MSNCLASKSVVLFQSDEEKEKEVDSNETKIHPLDRASSTEELGQFVPFYFPISKDKFKSYCKGPLPENLPKPFFVE